MTRAMQFRGLWGLAMALCAMASSATEYSGRLDTGNTALVGSDLGVAAFDGDDDVAQNVALHDFAVASAGTFTVKGSGLAVGGIEPYFTPFQRSGTGATFAGSNDDRAFLTGGDFLSSFAVVPGAHQTALSFAPDAVVTPVSEPGTYLLLLAGLGAIAQSIRRRAANRF